MSDRGVWLFEGRFQSRCWRKQAATTEEERQAADAEIKAYNADESVLNGYGSDDARTSVYDKVFRFYGPMIRKQQQMNKKEIFQKIRDISLRYNNIQAEDVQTVRLPKELTDRLDAVRDLEAGLQWPMWAVISGIIETFVDKYEKNDEI